jgi:hypothetical protein
VQRVLLVAVIALGCSRAESESPAAKRAPASAESAPTKQAVDLEGRRVATVVPSVVAPVAAVAKPGGAIAAAARALDVAGGNYNACARFDDGAVGCWGRCTMACDAFAHETSGPMKSMGITNVVDVAVGDSFACAVHADGSVSCWGSTRSGAVGVTAPDHVGQPRLVEGAHEIVEIAATQSMVCARTKAGDVLAWGGELAVDGGAKGHVPTPVAGMSGATAVFGDPLECCAQQGSGFACVAEGSRTATASSGRRGVCGCELASDGVLSCEMQGMPSSPDMRGEGYRAPPLACSIPRLEHVRDFVIDGESGYAIVDAGVVWRWGEIDSSYVAPAAMPGLPPVRAIAAGVRGAIFAVDEAGAIWGWGWSYEHGITASEERVATPVRVWTPARP